MPTAAITSSIEVAAKPLSSTEASATSRIRSLVSAPLRGVSCISLALLPARRNVPRVHLKTSLAEPLEWPPNLAARKVLKFGSLGARCPVPQVFWIVARKSRIFSANGTRADTPTQGAKHRGETSKIPGAAAATWRRSVPHRWRIGDDAYLSRRLGASSFRSFRPPQRPDRTHGASSLFRPLCFYGDRSRGRLHPGKPDLARQF